MSCRRTLKNDFIVILKIINMEGKRQSLQKGRASRFLQKSCLSQWWPWERRPILVVMKNPPKGFLGSLNRADQPIVLCPGQTTISDFYTKPRKSFCWVQNQKTQKSPHIECKNKKPWKYFYIWEIFMQHIVQKQNIPLFRSCPCLKPAAAERAHWLITQFILSPAAMNILHAHTTLLEPFPCVFKFGKFYMHISHLFNFLLFHLF